MAGNPKRAAVGCAAHALLDSNPRRPWPGHTKRPRRPHPERVIGSLFALWAIIPESSLLLPLLVLVLVLPPSS